MLRTMALAVLVTLSLSGAAHSAAGGTAGYDRRLGIVARASLSRAAPKATLASVLRVYVRCYRDRESFESTYERRSGESARRVIAYYAGGGDIHLRPGTCESVHAFIRGRRTAYTAGAYSILLHESLHRQGIRNERTATCLANDAVRWGAEWLGSSEARALRARDLAFTYSRLFAPPGYRMGKPDCLALVRRQDWPSFT